MVYRERYTYYFRKIKWIESELRDAEAWTIDPVIIWRYRRHLMVARVYMEHERLAFAHQDIYRQMIWWISQLDLRCQRLLRAYEQPGPEMRHSY